MTKVKENLVQAGTKALSFLQHLAAFLRERSPSFTILKIHQIGKIHEIHEIDQNQNKHATYNYMYLAGYMICLQNYE